jgi:hypothetical protein
VLGPSWLDDSWQDEIDELMCDADAALAEKPFNLAKYLATEDVSRALDTTAETPGTLASLQPSLSLSLEPALALSTSKLNISSEVANFLDYLDTIRFSQTPASQNRAVNNEMERDSTIRDVSIIDPTSKNHRSKRQHSQQDIHLNVLGDRTNNHSYHKTGLAKKNVGRLLNSFNRTSPVPKTPLVKPLPPSPEHRFEGPHRTVSEERPSPDVQGSPGRSLNESLNESMATYKVMQAPARLKQISENDWARLQTLEHKLEIALNEAYNERQSARDWAQAMKESVKKWVYGQRALIELERKQAAEKIVERDRAEIQDMEDALEKLERDLNAANLNHQAVERKLQDIIQHQANTISALEKRLEEKQSQLPSPDSIFNVPMMNAFGLTAFGQLSSRPTNLSPPSEQMRNQRIDPPASATSSETHSHLFASPEASRGQDRRLHSTSDGRRILKYRNGAEKEIQSDGSIIIRYINGDSKTVVGDVISYYHAAEKVRVFLTILNAIQYFCDLTSFPCLRLIDNSHQTPRRAASIQVSKQPN